MASSLSPSSPFALPEQFDKALRVYYVAFVEFVDYRPDAYQPPPSPRQAKSRDRLRRMPRVPFAELSTDVYDELRRRQQFDARPDTTPDKLPANEGFHPKRNQTRSHLAVLQQARFKDLVMDVLAEVIRRSPGLTDASELNLPGNETPPSISVPVMDKPPAPRTITTTTNASAPYQERQEIGMVDERLPVARTLHTATLVPEKSTMVEKSDDSDDSEDDGGSSTASPQRSPRKILEPLRAAPPAPVLQVEPARSPAEPLRSPMEIQMQQQQSQQVPQLPPARSMESPQSPSQTSPRNPQRDIFAQLQEKYSSLEEKAYEMETEITTLRVNLVEKDKQLELLSGTVEDKGSEEKIRELEEELFRTRAANKKMTIEVQLMETDLDKFKEERKKYATTREVVGLDEHESLQAKLQNQSQVIEEVRAETVQLISKLRELTEADKAWRTRVERLGQQVKALEVENTRLRTQQSESAQVVLNGRESASLRSSAGGFQKAVMAPGGAVEQKSFATFQMYVDEVLRLAPYVGAAEEDDEQVKTRFVDAVRMLVGAARQVSGDDETPLRTVATNQQSSATTKLKLKTRITAACNNVAVAAKMQCVSAGLAPVSVLDAAVAGLVSSVVELVRVVKIRG
ncbi:hypothetical protein BZA70DRAFT_313188 [Myxozyma melibiosi]|uniref:GIT Spa2 homology (SHD) domain-containing protein n=1 Tax=Myxozyma melibiosi TaxID=54550 RepID=A0ABR1EXX9_9ASCO